MSDEAKNGAPGGEADGQHDAAARRQPAQASSGDGPQPGAEPGAPHEAGGGDLSAAGAAGGVSGGGGSGGSGRLPPHHATPDPEETHSSDAGAFSAASGVSEQADGALEPAVRSGPAPQPVPGGRLAAWLAARGTRWGTATAIYVVVVVAILVAVNLVGSRITANWDVTAQHQLTLSAASRHIAAQVKRPVQIILFTQPGDQTGAQIAVLGHQYAQDSHGKITFRSVDPVTQTALAQQYNVQQYDTVVVQSGTNIQTVQPASMQSYNSAGEAVFSGESAITNAILRAGAPVTLRVDWLEGDGEPDITSGRHPDATQALKNIGYQVGTINLVKTNGVPSNVAALVIDSPTQDLAPGEIAALRRYAARGGHLIVLLPPQLKPLTNLDGLLASWGITPQNDVAIDMVQHYQSDPTQIVPHFSGSPITNPIQQANMATLLPGAQGLTLGHPKGYTVAPVLLTTAGTSGGRPSSWGMTNLQALLKGQISYTPGKDIAGPIAVAATTQAAKPPATPGTLPQSGAPGFRAVVFGNSLFISSGTLTGGQGAYISIQGNQDLFLNAVGWATGQSQGITVRPNPTLSTQVFLGSGTVRSLTLTFVAGVPLVCFLLGFGTWLSRRRL